MKSVNKIIIFSVIFVLSFFLESCVTPKVSYIEYNIPPQRLIKKVEANRRQIKNFYGKGTLLLKTNEFGEAKASFQVYLKKPDSIKISIYGPFGIDLAHALVSKDNFLFYDVLRNDLHFGSVDNKVLKRIFKVDLTFNELIDAFTGAVNLTEELSRVPRDYKVNDEDFVLTYARNDKEVLYRISNPDLNILDYKVIKGKDELLFGSYSNFRNFGEVKIPYEINVVNKSTNQSIEIDYRKIEVNTEMEKLTLDYPTDVNRIRW